MALPQPFRKFIAAGEEEPTTFHFDKLFLCGRYDGRVCFMSAILGVPIAVCDFVAQFPQHGLIPNGPPSMKAAILAA
jgi:hypothetical protein